MSIFTKQKSELLNKATTRFSKILPCGSKKSIDECFTIENMPNGQIWIMLWYNVAINNSFLNTTHCETIKIN